MRASERAYLTHVSVRHELCLVAVQLPLRLLRQRPIAGDTTEYRRARFVEATGLRHLLPQDIQAALELFLCNGGPSGAEALNFIAECQIAHRAQLVSHVS